MRLPATALALVLSVSPAVARPFDPSPWFADLAQARIAFTMKYANLEWLEKEHETDLDALFEDLSARLSKAHDDGEARAVFERLVRKTDDGHVEIEWPEPVASPVPNTSGPAEVIAPCATMGFDSRQNGQGTAFALPGYSPVRQGDGNPFAAGTTAVAGTKLGVLRIGVFQPQGFPEFCHAAMDRLGIRVDRLCDDHCQDQISDWIYPRLTAAIEDRVRQLKKAGSSVLLIDITANGGGSEWAEAVARIFSRRKIVSERRGMVRGEHWAKQWRDLGDQLRRFAAEASGKDRLRLLAWAADADSRLRDAESPCTNSGCKRIADAGFSSGLVGAARSGSFANKPWGPLVFSPAQFAYQDGVWNGPLIILVDGATGSAAEEFAAMLQDNKVAVVIGGRTAGAGCGHTNGGDPVMLTNSGAVLKLPDCVRYRADGSNEVRGIVPDVPVPIRYSDGVQFRARLVAQYLPLALARARRLAGTR